MRRTLKFTFLVLALSLSQCGKKNTKSTAVTIEVIPASPIVITSDLKIIKGGNPITVKGPWFRFQVKLNNDYEGKEPVTIVGVHVEVTSTNARGIDVITKMDFDPSQENFSTATVSCNYTDFGMFVHDGVPLLDPGFDPVAKKVNHEKLYISPDNSSSGCDDFGTPVFYMGNLPKSDVEGQIRYSVKVKPIGWFGDRSNPIDRFENYKTIYTQ